MVLGVQTPMIGGGLGFGESVRESHLRGRSRSLVVRGCFRMAGYLGRRSCPSVSQAAIGCTFSQKHYQFTLLKEEAFP